MEGKRAKMVQRRPLIAGNWKMNGLAAQSGEVEAIAALAAQRPDIDVALFLPATLVPVVAARAGAAVIGGQDVHASASGAFTGNISAAMLVDAGAKATLVGHSERRTYQHESSADVAAKAAQAHAHGLSVVLCVGEDTAIRDAGTAEAWVSEQLLQSLPADADPAWLTIAYEPIWAIGTGVIPTMDQIAAMHAALRAALRGVIGAGADAMRILYGGSVTGDNATDILALVDVDGALVGGASLTAAKFGPIIAAA